MDFNTLPFVVMRFRGFFMLMLCCVYASGSYAQPSETEAVLEADTLVGQKDQQIEATGDAVLSKDGKTLHADRIRYTPNDRQADAQGNVLLEQQSDRMSGPHLHIDMRSGSGVMEQPQFHFQETDGRGSASRLDMLDKQHYRLDDASYTTCPAGNDDWQLHANQLDIDHVSEIGVAHGAVVEFKGVPFIYTPWMDFPLNDHRRSGFLSPVYGGSSNNGIDIALPYYWNIAPQMDATLTPRFMFKRGVQLNNEFRYMGETYRGEAHADILPNDKLTNTTRQRFALKQNQRITDDVTAYVDYNRVMDDAYFRDLSMSANGAPVVNANNTAATAANSAAQVNLMQQGGLNWNENGWNSAFRVQRYQTLQDPTAPFVAPYARMPQITTNTVQNLDNMNLAFTADYVEFSHPTLLNGKRLVLTPSVSYDLVRTPSFYVIPKLTLSSTNYVMGNNNTLAVPNTMRNMPLFSLDSGLAFERETQVLGGDYIQTLEPRAYYVYVPYRNQNLLPNFDSALADFNLTQMFTENRFVGNDRIGDANQVTLATTTRWLAASNGAEHLRVTVGERFSFAAPQVNLATPSGNTSRSDILLAVSGGISRRVSLDSLIDFDPNQSRTQQYSWMLHYRPEPGKTLNFGYQFQRSVTQQVDVSGQWPIMQNWGAVAKMNYSFPDKRILNSIAGVEYNQACWTARFVVQRYNPTTTQTVTGFYVQLDLNNFMQAGSSDAFFGSLKQSVPGYTKTNALSPTPPQTNP